MGKATASLQQERRARVCRSLDGAPLRFNLCELVPAVPRGTGGSGSSRMESGAACMTNTGNGPGQEGAGQQLKELAGPSLSGPVSSVRKRRSEAGCRPRPVGTVCFKFVRYPGRPGPLARAGMRWTAAQGSCRSKRFNQLSQEVEIRSRVQAAGGRRRLFQVYSLPAGPAGPGRKALDSSSRKL